jgi:hypothetical protein
MKLQKSTLFQFLNYIPSIYLTVDYGKILLLQTNQYVNRKL